MGQALTLTFQGTSALLQRLQKIVSLKLKLLSSLLYLLSSIYIFAKFINSLLKPWLDKVGYTNKVGYRVSKVKVRVLMVVYRVRFSVILVLVLVLVLAKLFLRRWLICLKVNSPLFAVCSLILALVYSIGLSSCSVLQSDCRTITHLSFLTHTP